MWKQSLAEDHMSLNADQKFLLYVHGYKKPDRMHWAAVKRASFMRKNDKMTGDIEDDEDINYTEHKQ